MVCRTGNWSPYCTQFEFVDCPIIASAVCQISGWVNGRLLLSLFKKFRLLCETPSDFSLLPRSSILKQVQSSQPNKLPSQKGLLVLGEYSHYFSLTIGLRRVRHPSTIGSSVLWGASLSFAWSQERISKCVPRYDLIDRSASGDNEVGKTTLMGKLAGVEDPKRGSGLEYHHLLIKDDYTEDTTRLGVWVSFRKKTEEFFMFTYFSIANNHVIFPIRA